VTLVIILGGLLVGGTGSLVNVNGTRRAVAWTDGWPVNVCVKSNETTK
jgi:hypothetical protein